MKDNTIDGSFQNNDENDEIVQYKKLLNKRLEKSDLLINQLLLENEMLQKKLDTLSIQHAGLQQEYKQTCDKLVLIDEKLNEQEDNDIILNDFLEHYLNLRIHSTSTTTIAIHDKPTLNDKNNSNNSNSNTNNNNNNTNDKMQDEIVIDISQSNPEKTVVLDYKLIIKNDDVLDSNEGTNNGEDDKTIIENKSSDNKGTGLTKNKNTIVVFVPLLSHRNMQELMVLQEKLPEYLLTTIKFPLDYLPKLYGKLQKGLNK